MTATPFAASIALPPPTATTKSPPASFIAATPPSTSGIVGFGVTLSYTVCATSASSSDERIESRMPAALMPGSVTTKRVLVAGGLGALTQLGDAALAEDRLDAQCE